MFIRKSNIQIKYEKVALGCCYCIWCHKMTFLTFNCDLSVQIVLVATVCCSCQYKGKKYVRAIIIKKKKYLVVVNCHTMTLVTSDFRNTNSALRNVLRCRVQERKCSLSTQRKTCGPSGSMTEDTSSCSALQLFSSRESYPTMSHHPLVRDSLVELFSGYI